MSSNLKIRTIASCQIRTVLTIFYKRGLNMFDIEKRIGGKITEIRLSQRLTQAQLAEMVNLSVESISRMERGVNFPSLKTIGIIADSLNVPLKSFFEFDEHPSQDKSFERELSKVVGFLRTLSKKEIMLAHKILKVVFKSLKQSAWHV